jgi:hypothetical protein
MTIQGAEGMSAENIRDEINRGGRLVIYTYCVSILVMTFKRPTDIRLVKAGHNPAAASWPYVCVSLLFGWWGIPWGPIYTVECIYRNLCGGLDVTEAALRDLQPAVRTAPASAVRSDVPATAQFRMPPTPERRFDLRVAGLLLGAVCLVIGLGISIFCYHRQQHLTVVLASGLDQPYSITLNGQPHTLRPYATKVLELPEGTFVLQDAAGGTVVGAERTFTLSAPFFDHLGSDYLAIINPDRVAILVNSDIPYYSDGTVPPKDEKPVYSLLTNQQSYFITKPDYVIEKAEPRISMPTGTSRLVRTRLENLPVTSLSAVMTSLAEKNGYSAVREHLMLLGRQRADEGLLMAAQQFLKPEDIRAFYAIRLAERPVRVEWHRYYQGQMSRAFPEHDLVAEYRKYLAAEPDNGALIYLLARELSDADEQRSLWPKAVAARQPCYYAEAAMGYDALSDGHFEEALAHYEASRKAGILSSSLRHYRHLTHYALNRTEQLLPELAEERKQRPLDLGLAEEEITATYSLTHDQAAINKVKASCLAAFRSSGATEENLADADAYLSASIAYTIGDIAGYSRHLARFDSPSYQFRAALSAGKLAEAVKSLSATPGRDPNAELLLSLLAHRAGDRKSADEHFQAAVNAMNNQSPEYTRLVALLKDPHPDASQISSVRIDIESKRILLTALGVQQPSDQAQYFTMARKLNVHPGFPHHFLQSFLAL